MDVHKTLKQRLFPVSVNVVYFKLNHKIFPKPDQIVSVANPSFLVFVPKQSPNHDT